ncbi:MAG: DUF3592 domain-containing protein [Bryobacteraceae bacterium]|jgi:hypothetical protein
MRLDLGLAVSVGLGLLFAAALLLSVMADARLRRWPAAAATILESGIRLGTVSGTGGTVRTAGGQPQYELTVRYSYEIRGWTYTGNRLSNHPPTQNLRNFPERPALWLAALRDQYAPGIQTQVRYDPKHPEASYLFFRANSGLWILAGCSAACFAIAAALWMFAPR